MPSGDLVVKIPFIGRDQVSKEIKKMRGNMRNFGDTSRSVFKRMRSDALSTRKIIGGILGARLISSGISVLKTQVDTVVEELVKFDHAATKAASRYGFDRNAKEFKQIGAAARETGAITKFTAGESALAIDAFAKSNFKLVDALALVKPTAKLAMAADLELAESAKIASTSLALFGKDVSEFGAVADVLAFTANKTKTDLAEMFETLRAGGSTKMEGSVETFSAFARSMADFGIVGSKAGTSIKTGLLRMTTGSAEAGKELKKLGVKYYEIVNGKKESRGAIDIVEDLEKKFAKMGSASVSKSMTRIFGLESIRGMETLFKTGSAKLRQFEKEARATTGYVDSTSAKMGLSYESKIKEIQSAIVEAGFSIIEKYGDEIPKALDYTIEKIRNLDIKKIHDGIAAGITMSKKAVALIKEAVPYLKTIAIIWAGFKVTSGLNTVVSTFAHLRESVSLMNRGIDPLRSNLSGINNDLTKVNKTGTKGLNKDLDASKIKAIGVLDKLSILAAVGYAAYSVADQVFKGKDKRVARAQERTDTLGSKYSDQDLITTDLKKLKRMEEDLSWAKTASQNAQAYSRNNVADWMGAVASGGKSNFGKYADKETDITGKLNFVRDRFKKLATEKLNAAKVDYDNKEHTKGEIGDFQRETSMFRELSNAIREQNDKKIQVETTINLTGNNIPDVVTAQSTAKAPQINRASLGEN